MDQGWQPLSGFTLTDANELNDNDLGIEVKWRGSADLSKLRERKIHLRFVMRDCKLYAFEFADR